MISFLALILLSSKAILFLLFLRFVSRKSRHIYLHLQTLLTPRSSPRSVRDISAFLPSQYAFLQSHSTYHNRPSLTSRSPPGYFSTQTLRSPLSLSLLFSLLFSPQLLSFSPPHFYKGLVHFAIYTLSLIQQKEKSH